MTSGRERVVGAYFRGGAGHGAGDAPPRPSSMPIDVGRGLISLGGSGFGVTPHTIRPGAANHASTPLPGSLLSERFSTISAMPRLSAFYGIVIAMYHREHGIPHFHAVYAGRRASIAIETLEILGGSLPDRAYRMVREWAELHRDELEANWQRARDREPLERIDPLP